MAKLIKINVPQKDGEITISHATPEPLTFNVTDGTVTAHSDLEVELLLGRVDGATLAPPPK